jgi:hypothetical protein
VSGDLPIPVCEVDGRRDDLLAPQLAAGATAVDLNGIDFVEVDPGDHRVLRVTFLKPLPPGAYGLPDRPRERIAVSGGTRIVGIRAVRAEVESSTVLRIETDEPGDYSPYVLTLTAEGLDPVRRSATFSFMASCSVDADCRERHECPPEEAAEPALDYLAKDYAGFRRLMLDLLPRLDPGWVERNPADLGMALVELLAYQGDRLSYFQDAVAAEAYLDTLRRRISARRHARLVDYHMHDGRNAWSAVHVTVSASGSIPRGTPLFTRILAPLRGGSAPPGTTIEAGAIGAADLAGDPALAEVVGFETAHDAELHPENNEIRIHAFGDEDCCLAAGATEAYLYVVPNPQPGGGRASAARPLLRDGDHLIFEEVLGPASGLKPDASPRNRRLVRIEGEPQESTDPLYSRTLLGDALQVRERGRPSLPLLRVRWRRTDALRLPLCISARADDGTKLRNVSVARGNVVLADHGLTVKERMPAGALDGTDGISLAAGPLTMECRGEEAGWDPLAGGLVRPERRALDGDVREARPAVALLLEDAAGTVAWNPARDLLDSTPFAEQFAVEVDDDGRARIRFGDGEYGRRPSAEAAVKAVYRVGNGRAGNVGAEALAHVAMPGQPDWLVAIRNPIAADGGVEPETIEQVRQLAPAAFRAEQYRAVTEADWAAAAGRLPSVRSAVAGFRWTGSWHTVFVALDPSDPAHLIDMPRGATRLAPDFEATVRAFLARYRIAGYDVELRPPRFAPLEVELEVCAAPGHFRADVARAVREALSARVLADGRRGFFHPDDWSFGRPVRAGGIYAAVERVEGVESAMLRGLRRFGQADAGELERGLLAVGPWEIARLDDDPSFAERGVLRVEVKGGKA